MRTLPCAAAWLACAALACGGGPPPGSTTDARPAAATPPTPAPSLDWNGLQLGISGEPELRAFLERAGLDCPTAPSPTHASLQTRCAGDLPLHLLPDRRVEGRLRELRLSRPEGGPIHTIASLRKHSDAASAARDFDSAAAGLVARFGPPHQGRPEAERAALEQPMGRLSVEWRFTDLQVRLTAARAAQGAATVTEVWESPGVEAGLALRPGAELAPGQDPHAGLPRPATPPAAPAPAPIAP